MVQTPTEAAAAAAAPTLVIIPSADFSPVRALYVTVFLNSSAKAQKGKLYLPHASGIQSIRMPSKLSAVG